MSSVGFSPEVTVTLGKRMTTVALAAAALLLLPGFAQAQRQATPRQAVPRPGPVPSRPIHGGGVYHGPVAYPPYYARPYWYGAYYYPYYGYPWSFSVGFGCCGYPYYGYPYYGYPYGYPYDISASLRLQVSPREAEVFVDGYYAGTVDDFDGTFQRLRVEPGDHELEVFMPGHRSYQQRVYLQPGKTFNVRHEMEPLGPGEAEVIAGDEAARLLLERFLEGAFRLIGHLAVRVDQSLAIFGEQRPEVRNPLFAGDSDRSGEGFGAFGWVS